MANIIDDKNLQDLLDRDTLELIGGENLPEEKKQELYQKMAGTVQNRVIARIYDHLSEEEGKEFDQVIDQNDNKKIDEFLKGKNIDVISLLAQEAIVYKTEILALFEQAKKE